MTKDIKQKFKVGDLVTLHRNITDHLGMREGALGIVVEVKEVCASQYINEAYLVKWHHNPYVTWEDMTHLGLYGIDEDIMLVYYGYELELVVEEE